MNTTETVSYDHPLLVAMNIMKVFPNYESATARSGEYGYAAALRSHDVRGSGAGVYAGLRILSMIKNGVISQGIDQDGIRERLMRLDAVLAYAQTHGYRVTWG